MVGSWVILNETVKGQFSVKNTNYFVLLPLYILTAITCFGILAKKNQTGSRAEHEEFHCAGSTDPGPADFYTGKSSPELYNKPGKLTPKEFDIVKDHTTIAGEALDKANHIYKEEFGKDSYLALARDIATIELTTLLIVLLFAYSHSFS